MRELNAEELKQVVGGTYECCYCECEPEKVKNNNGKGNGNESGPAPGNSGFNPSPNADEKRTNDGR